MQEKIQQLAIAVENYDDSPSHVEENYIFTYFPSNLNIWIDCGYYGCP